MKRFIPLLIIAIFILFISPAKALSPPEIRFIPDRFSANSSFLAIVEHTENESIRVEWTLVYPYDSFGLFPRVGDRFVCYFSNTDYESTCGPSPFPDTATYTFKINSTNQYDEKSGIEIGIDVGGIKLNRQVDVVDENVYITVWPIGGPVSGVMYEAYYADSITTVPGKSGALTYDPVNFRYTANITLDPDEYYLALSATGTDDFGGDLVKVAIAGGAPPGCPECPTDGDGVSYIEVNGVSLDVLLAEGADFEYRNLAVSNITNLGSETLTDLSVRIDSSLTSYLSVELDSDELEPNATMSYTVRLNNIQSGMDITTNAELLSGSDVLKEIPISLRVSIIRGDTGPIIIYESGDFLTIQPTPIMSGNFLVEQELSQVFTLTNRGSQTLTSFNYSTTGNIGYITELTFPSSIPVNGSGSMTVSLSPSSSGNYHGTIIITTDAGSKTILVNANFYSDVSYSITSLRDDLTGLTDGLTSEQLDQLSLITYDIEFALDTADSFLDSLDYAEAEKKFQEAQAKFEVLNSMVPLIGSVTPSNGGVSSLDFTSVIVILVIVILAAIGLWFYFTKYKSRGGGGEEEFEEEFKEEFK